MASSVKASSLVVIFPFMAQGHTLPLLDMAKALVHRGLKIIIITTPLNVPFINSKVSNYHPTISLSILPFPRLKELPERCENTASLPSMDEFLIPFIAATKKLKSPFEDIIKEMINSGSPPICVISDFFLGWTLESCRLFNIPRLVFHGMGAWPMVILKNISLHGSCMDVGACSTSDSVIHLWNLPVPFTLNKWDFPHQIWDSKSPHNDFLNTISELEEADVNSWGIVVNSFEELESQPAISALESLYHTEEAKAWCVGPLLLYDLDDQIDDRQDDQCIEWLDNQAGSGAVIYVSFGTQAHLSNNQMDEIALGLEMAGHPFIWVVRSKTWVTPSGWEHRIKQIKGLLVRDWVDQRSILAHKAVGGFLSHCGWNSVLESLSMGVPLLTWPTGAEQPLNAKYVAMGLRAGIMISQKCDADGGNGRTVNRQVICDGIKQLMSSDEGRNAKERAIELGKLARQALEKGGSSDTKLDELIKSLTNKDQKQKKNI